MAPRSWRDLPPAAGAFVMATGVISIGLHRTGFEWPSRILLALAGAVWALLAIDFAVRFLSQPTRWVSEAQTPPGLSGIGATTVLGTRLALLGWHTGAWIALGLAVVWWPVLLRAVMRHWNRRMPGAEFLVCVSTQGLAVLTATLAKIHDSRWLAMAAVAWFCLGLGLYVLALTRFDFRQIWSGAGDQWVATGALAISALAAAVTVDVPGWKPVAHGALITAALTLLMLNWAVYSVLVVAEIANPRPGYDIRRWATVFPLGMTAVATLTTGVVADLTALRVVGRILLLVAVVAWLATLIGFLNRTTTRWHWQQPRKSPSGT
ncbi:tellurite resistance/C4-dicarboxylate transporter family protein [Nocardia sp. JMUB6875]|uniref:tellurite resistance/C4-dicarboxylate transporter family protein n=1 Tax=Nocardia sp. JMUB6875 TaxID=3158170 RepID=UPI0032E799DB